MRSNGVISVAELPPQDGEIWDEYVYHTRSALPFHLSGWRTVMQKCYGFPSWYLVAREGGRIEGVLPLFKVTSKLVGTSVSSLPGGVCTENKTAAMALLEQAKEITRAAGATCLVIRDSRCRWCDEMEWRDDCSVSIRELPADCEMLREQLSRQIRQHVRKAETCGVWTDVGMEYVDEFYTVFCDLMHEKGIPVFSRVFLDAVVEALAGHFVVTTARLGGKVIGAIFHFTLRDTMFAVWGGAPSRYLEVRPNHVLWWGSMRHAIGCGYRYLDMGRSLRGSGLETFKERWGSSTQPVYRSFFLVGSRTAYDPLARGCTNPTYRLFTQAWRRIPGPVVRFLGPKLRRHMPFG